MSKFDDKLLYKGMNDNDDDDNDDDDDDDDDEYVGGINSKSNKKKRDVNDFPEDDDDDDNDDDDNDDDDDDVSETDQNDPIVKNIHSNIADLENISDYESDNDDTDDNYLQKFEESTKHNIIADFHPEMNVHNYDEIDILSRVVRNENGIIIDPLHKTLPFITKYERARILGERSKQINAGAKVFVNVEPGVIDGYLIALMEFEQKKLPFIIKRPLPNGGSEYWKFRDLEII